MPAEHHVLEDAASARLPRGARPLPREHEDVHEVAEPGRRPCVPDGVHAADLGVDVLGELREVADGVERPAGPHGLVLEPERHLGGDGELCRVHRVGERLLALALHEGAVDDLHELGCVLRPLGRADALPGPLDELRQRLHVLLHVAVRAVGRVRHAACHRDAEALGVHDEVGEERVVRVHHLEDVLEPEERLVHPRVVAAEPQGRDLLERLAVAPRRLRAQVREDRRESADRARRGLPAGGEREERGKRDLQRLRPGHDVLHRVEHPVAPGPEDLRGLEELARVAHRLAAGEEVVRLRADVDVGLGRADDEPVDGLRRLHVLGGHLRVAVAEDRPLVRVEPALGLRVHDASVLDAGLRDVVPDGPLLAGGERLDVVAGDRLPDLVGDAGRLDGLRGRVREVERVPVGARRREHVDERRAEVERGLHARRRLDRHVADGHARREQAVQAVGRLVGEAEPSGERLAGIGRALVGADHPGHGDLVLEGLAGELTPFENAHLGVEELRIDRLGEVALRRVPRDRETRPRGLRRVDAVLAIADRPAQGLAGLGRVEVVVDHVEHRTRHVGRRAAVPLRVPEHPDVRRLVAGELRRRLGLAVALRLERVHHELAVAGEVAEERAAAVEVSRVAAREPWHLGDRAVEPLDLGLDLPDDPVHRELRLVAPRLDELRVRGRLIPSGLHVADPERERAARERGVAVRVLGGVVLARRDHEPRLGEAADDEVVEVDGRRVPGPALGLGEPRRLRLDDRVDEPRAVAVRELRGDRAPLLVEVPERDLERAELAEVPRPARLDELPLERLAGQGLAGQRLRDPLAARGLPAVERRAVEPDLAPGHDVVASAHPGLRALHEEVDDARVVLVEGHVDVAPAEEPARVVDALVLGRVLPGRLDEAALAPDVRRLAAAELSDLRARAAVHAEHLVDAVDGVHEDVDAAAQRLGFAHERLLELARAHAALHRGGQPAVDVRRDEHGFVPLGDERLLGLDVAPPDSEPRGHLGERRAVLPPGHERIVVRGRHRHPELARELDLGRGHEDR